MNSKNIIDNLLRNKKAERIGIFDHVWPETCLEWAKDGHVDENGKPLAFTINYI